MFRTRRMHAASGLVSSSMELLANASRQFAPKIVDLCSSHSRFVLLFLVRERGGRRKLPAELSALYDILVWYTCSCCLMLCGPDIEKQKSKTKLRRGAPRLTDKRCARSSVGITATYYYTPCLAFCSREYGDC